MTLLSRTFLAVSSMAMAARAVPNVTPVEAGFECGPYPKEDWNIQVDQCTNSTTGEECDVEGLQNNVQVVSTDWDGYTGTGQGFVSIVPNADANTNKMRCMIGSRSVTMMTVYAPENSGEFDGDFTSLGLYEIDGSKLMAWGGDGPIVIPKPYFHLDEAGDRLDGLFLGHDNITTWGIQYHEPRPDSAEKDPQPYYSVRLLEGTEDEDLDEGESATFLKVSGA